MRYAILMSASLSIATLGGCAKKSGPAEAFFSPDDRRSPVTQALDIQAANGAAADRTLYAVHFDGRVLNGLGRAKLDAMMGAGVETSALLVYVDAQASDVAERQEAVRGYLKGMGLGQVRVEPGCDPRAMHSVAGELKRLEKTESGASATGGQPPAEVPQMPPVMPK